MGYEPKEQKIGSSASGPTTKSSRNVAGHPTEEKNSEIQHSSAGVASSALQGGRLPTPAVVLYSLLITHDMIHGIKTGTGYTGSDAL